VEITDMPTAVQKITLSASRDIPFNKLVLNFGESKGRGFDHVVILPTGPMQKWLADPDSNLAAQSRA
jgi:DNA helicase II / ATP-dependent DNA helicase PcrA